MAKNIYTTQFYTKVETDSRINQKADEINLGVNQTLTNYSTTNEMNSAITLKANEINSTVSQKVGKDEIISKINQSAESISIDANRININGTVSANGNFKIDTSGNMECNNAKVNGGKIELKGGTGSSPNFEIYSNDYSEQMYAIPTYISCSKFLGETMHDANIQANEYQASINASTYYGRANFHAYPDKVFMEVIKDDTTPDNSILAIIDDNATQIWLRKNNNSTIIQPDGIWTPTLTQTSLEKEKKNFEKFENGLETLKNIDIYKYNLKNEKDDDKKHIGFVIGNKFNYSKEVTSKNNDGVDLYSFISVCCKAIQEQQEEIEELKKEIEKLKGGK